MKTAFVAVNARALRNLFLLFVLLLLTVAALALFAGGRAQAASPVAPSDGTEPLPPGATIETLLTGMDSPVAMAFDPAGRLFYTEKASGKVRLFENGVLAPSPVITFTVDSDGERGLLGIAIDPGFNTNHFIYVYYTCGPAGGCPSLQNQVVRFEEHNGVGSNPTTIFFSPQSAPNHNGGNIHFGPDGKLYISVGDNGDAANSQNVTVKNGKIHRINSDGTIPSDNPVFTQTGALPSLFAMGLRNTFDFTFDPLSTGKMFASENGPNCDDELNRIEGGYNYGWRANYPCDDPAPDPTYNTIAPLWYIGSGACCEAPTGITFYAGDRVAQWHNELFMATYNTGLLRHFYLDPTRHTVTAANVVQGVTVNMDMETGPDGALWYIEGGGYTPGTLKRITGPGATATQTASATLTPTLPPLVTNTPTATATCAPSFSYVASPNRGSEANILLGSAAVSASDAWAVGYSGPAGGTQATLIEHWNGTAWSIVPSPNASGFTESALTGVSALSSTDVWAVGYSSNPGGSASGHVLALHWNGTAWSIVPTPQLSEGPGVLLSVAAISASDVWAVGYANQAGEHISISIHWNGTDWAEVAVPGTSTGELRGVAAGASNDVWAVGYYNTFPGFHTLTVHWNGAAWTTVSSPNGPDSSVLQAVDVISANDVWAVGYVSYTGDGPLALHWDGSVWSVIPVPRQGVGSGGAFFGVDAISPTEVIGVGQYFPNETTNLPLAMVWDGTAWNAISTEMGGGTTGLLTGVSTSGGHAWAVGDYAGAGGIPRTLIESYSNTCVCQPSFSDVRPSDWFYTYVGCLYCRGAISGYADGTFRPYAETTRGQMAKITVLALSIPITTPSGTPTFNDVPVTDPFYPYVETASAYQIVSGYSCGGAGEPCPGRYFRPNASVTRGQLSKIAVVAAIRVYGWALRDPQTPSFSDVPPGSPFYAYIETAVCHGIVSGYAGGTFRPGNNATRAQIAKIVCLMAENASPCDATPTPVVSPTTTGTPALH